ncbi:flippase [Colwellia sp. RSH04]|uniref:flippase n=1 Tax=Colwellia sp. RSH04 TaxID=2305464 RepID=UPI000E58EE96|nr:flippase [Colwellia sp. RSH04]RHW74900.1 flippase [Colwellia sp. RSH04]
MSHSVNIKNSLLLIVEKVILLGMAFLTSVLIARIAGPELFGQFAYITSFSALFIPLCTMGLASVVTKYFVLYPQRSHYLFLNALALRGLGGLFSIIIGGFVAYIITENKAQLTNIIFLLTLQSFTVFYLVEHFFLAKEKVIITLRVRLPILFITNLLKIIAILKGANLQVLIILHGLDFVAISACYMFLYYTHKQPSFNKDVRTLNKRTIFHLIGKGKWLLFSGVAAALYLKIDQVMLASYYGPEEVAHYAVAAKLSEFWYVFPILIANSFNPKLIKIKQISQKEFKKLLLTILSILIAIAFFISLITFLFSSSIIELIYGKAYQNSAAILNIHIFATLFIFQRAILSKWLIIESNYKFSLISHGAGAISNVILNIIFIPKYGGIGAAWSTLISYMIASFLSLVIYKETRPFMLLMTIAMLTWPKFLSDILLSKRKQLN